MGHPHGHWLMYRTLVQPISSPINRWQDPQVIRDLAIQHSPQELFDPHRSLIVSIFAQSFSYHQPSTFQRRENSYPNQRLFTSYKACDGGHVIFGRNLKGKVVGGDNINHDSITISNVEHVSGLAFYLTGHRRNGLYTCKLGDNSKQQICLASVVDNSMLWHRRLGHANIRLVQNLASNDLVRNLPKLSFERYFCDTCGLGSQGNANNRIRKEVLTTRVLELLHLDLVGQSPIQSYEGNFYTLIIVDDHSNYTWVAFVESKEDVLEKFKILCRNLKNLHDCSIVSIVTNHSSEFDKLQFGSFCEQHGMSYNLSGPFTSQSNEIVERTHLNLRKMSRAMLADKAYIVLNKEPMRIKEYLNVIFDERFPKPKSSPLVEDDRINEPIVQDLNGSPSLQVNVSDEGYPKSLKEARGHPIEFVIGELNERTLRSKAKQAYEFRMTFPKVQIARV
ncbi:retrovirus-related pol polyprotein from transposon TNT 1-94 [Tanacetum coccineum]